MLYMPHSYNATDFPFVLRIQIPERENASLAERPMWESPDESNVLKNFICIESSMHVKIQDPDSAKTAVTGGRRIRSGNTQPIQ